MQILRFWKNSRVQAWREYSKPFNLVILAPEMAQILSFWKNQGSRPTTQPKRCAHCTFSDLQFHLSFRKAFHNPFSNSVPMVCEWFWFHFTHPSELHQSRLSWSFIQNLLGFLAHSAGVSDSTESWLHGFCISARQVRRWSYDAMFLALFVFYYHISCSRRLSWRHVRWEVCASFQKWEGTEGSSTAAWIYTTSWNCPSWPW